MTNNIKSFTVKEIRFDILRILLNEGEWYAVKISNRLGFSNIWVSKQIKKAEELGLVTRESDAGKEIVELTENGKELAREFERLERVFQEVDNE